MTSSPDAPKPPLMEGLVAGFSGVLADELFTTSTHSSLNCMICSGLPAKPLRCKECQKVICQPCAKKWWADHLSCPSCRGIVETESDLQEGWGPAYSALLEGVVIVCPHSPSGCPVSGSVDEVLSHVGHGGEMCEWMVMDCGLGSCSSRVIQKNIKQHRVSCEWRGARCRDCGELMYQREVEGHLRWVCEKRVVGCPRQCGDRGVKHCELESHAKECPLELVKCHLCSEEIMRKDTPSHLAKAEIHMPLMVGWMIRAEEEIAGLKKGLKDSEERRREEVAKLEARVGILQDSERRLSSEVFSLRAGLTAETKALRKMMSSDREAFRITTTGFTTERFSYDKVKAAADGTTRTHFMRDEVEHPFGYSLREGGKKGLPEIAAGKGTIFAFPPNNEICKFKMAAVTPHKTFIWDAETTRTEAGTINTTLHPLKEILQRMGKDGSVVFTMQLAVRDPVDKNPFEDISPDASFKNPFHDASKNPFTGN